MKEALAEWKEDHGVQHETGDSLVESKGSVAVTQERVMLQLVRISSYSIQHHLQLVLERAFQCLDDAKCRCFGPERNRLHGDGGRHVDDGNLAIGLAVWDELDRLLRKREKRDRKRRWNSEGRG